ncbi:MAG: DUF1405 domain-containing protein [Chloroflexaceae bacterium]|nr:DUF1405 domain-containing protein [Chloroflexaceae bacterium]
MPAWLNWFAMVFQAILLRPWLFALILAANLFGAIVGGIYWYGPMLWTSPWWAMPFVPDCPLAALLWSIAALGVWAKQRWYFFYALTAFACIKYGAWTIAFWLWTWLQAGQIFPLEALLFVSHIGLLLQGLLLVTFVQPLAMPGRIAVVSWFILSVQVDYRLGFHPPLGGFVSVSFAFWVATLLTALLATGLLLLPLDQRRSLCEASTSP